MLRRALLGVSRNHRIKDLATRWSTTDQLVQRFVAGEETADAVRVTRQLAGGGLLVTIDHLGEDTQDTEQADRVVLAYLDLLAQLSADGLTREAEVSVKLTALGLMLPDGDRIALDNARMICVAALQAGTTVTVDMEDHTTTDRTLDIVHALRKDFPDTGAVIQAYLHRSEADLRELVGTGSRVRLCKGAYSEPEEVAFTERADIDKAYVRCLKILMAGDGVPLVATHDPRLIAIAQDLAHRNRRSPDSYEFQLLHGIRPTEQHRLANAGHRVRVYLPYGEDWYGYLVRRLAEKPANLALFMKSMISKN